MQQLDERVLEYLDEEGWGTPAIIARDLVGTVSEERVQERCRVLARAGLVAPFFEGSEMFELTTWGMLYLGGSVDADHLPA